MKQLTKDEILGTIVSRFFDDLEFIETLNNLTYSRKVQLKRTNLTDQHGKNKND